MRYLWGMACVALIVASSFVLFKVGIDPTDPLFALLGGAVVGAISAIAISLNSAASTRAASLLFSSITGSLAAWLIAIFLIKLTGLSLFGSAALAFDLLVGVIGATTVVVSFARPTR